VYFCHIPRNKNKNNIYFENIMHIKQIIINNFWKQGNIIWDLEPDVNVLVGINGSGKTTILKIINEIIADLHDMVHLKGSSTNNRFYQGCEITFDDDNKILVLNDGGELRLKAGNGDIKIPMTLIQTLDIPMNFDSEVLKSINQLLGYSPKTTLDFEVAKCVKKFTDYKNKIDNEVLSKVKNKETIDITTIYEKIDKFYTLINQFFKETNKKINDKKEPFFFTPNNISFTELSSGEKQLLLLFLTVFLQQDTDNILLLDEPEISLHLSWQRILIDTLRKINPNCQLIIATHSPTIYGDGWLNNRKKMEDIFIRN
jgi:ABC-type cobalamin/Fe3+-siderophores transport system ATPase subunit